MKLEEQQVLARESVYLKLRRSQLQDVVVGLSAELQRAREQREYASARRHWAGAPSPLAGG